MRTRQICREDWPKFFNSLSQKHEGLEVSLEVFGLNIGNQVEERHIFLAGLTAELSEEDTRSDKIEIMFGESPDRHLTHVVTAPTEVDLQQTDLGVASALRIRAADGTTSLLYLS
jgi:hypothetical protein